VKNKVVTYNRLADGKDLNVSLYCQPGNAGDEEELKDIRYGSKFK